MDRIMIRFSCGAGFRAVPRVMISLFRQNKEIMTFLSTAGDETNSINYKKNSRHKFRRKQQNYSLYNKRIENGKKSPLQVDGGETAVP